MRKAFGKYITQSGLIKELFMPTNGRNIVDQLTKGNVYTILYRLGNRQARVTAIYEDTTDYYKSLLVRDLSRRNSIGEFVQMAIPTENVIQIQLDSVFNLK